MVQTAIATAPNPLSSWKFQGLRGFCHSCLQEGRIESPGLEASKCRSCGWIKGGDLAERVIKGVYGSPREIHSSLIPLDGSKRPVNELGKLAPDWLERRWELPELADLIRRGKAKAIGIRTGSESGIFCCDFDGPGSEAIWAELSGGEPLPDSLAWSSGRDGHFQIAFRLPEDFPWERARKIFVTDRRESGGGRLEIRGDGHQSVLFGLHPSGSEYQWFGRSREILLAPSWLQELMIDSDSAAIAESPAPAPAPERITITKPCIFPTALWPAYKNLLKIWLLARGLDFGKGQGWASVPLAELCELLGRAPSTIWRYLKKASDAGLIRHYEISGDHATIYYSSLRRVALAAGIEGKIGGAICALEIADLKNLSIRCSEAILLDRQQQSWWAAKEALKGAAAAENQKSAPGREKPPEIPKASEILNLAALRKPASRVLGRFGNFGRFIGISEGFHPFGGNQAGAAEMRRSCTKTIQRHCDPEYRENRNLGEFEKGQLAQRIQKDPSFPKFLAKSGISELAAEASRYLIVGERQVFFALCNLYEFGIQLVRKPHLRKRSAHKPSPPRV